MAKLKNFVKNRMRMSHIYQPVMIKTLLLEGGRATKTSIAQSISKYDLSQLEYYESIINKMVGRVLRNHDIVTKKKNTYVLNEFAELSESEINEIVKLCDYRIEEYINKRGEKIWQHRRKNRIPVRGSIRYEVLKRAKGRCELCGISSEERALEVDHIVPKSLGGEDSINNYQALCYTCNANKRDIDSTDFRNQHETYASRSDSCIFCQVNKERVITKNNLAYLIYDKYPVAPLHALIIPNRHCETYFELTQAEINAVNQLALASKEIIQETDPSVKGFNLGINNGVTAGQTISHCHIHLIPRRLNDVENPVGGVRNIFPGKGAYG